MKLIKSIDVYLEEDYSRFELNPNNREIKQVHVKNLAEDIKLEGYNTNFPIIVKEIDGKFRIFKGHHRFLACKSINHPIIFTINNDLQEEDLIKGERVQKSINITDGAKMYERMGLEEYKKLERIVKQYNVPFKIAIMFLSSNAFYDPKIRQDVMYGKLKITEEMEERLRTRAANFNVLTKSKRLYYSQYTDFRKILPILDDYDLTAKFKKYLNNKSFSITLNRKDFKKEFGKTYPEVINELIKDIEI